MWVYEVNLKTEPTIAKEFSSWLADHLQHMLGTGCFLSAERFLVEDNSEWVCIYKLESKEKLQEYFDRFADEMRADGKNRFGDQFKATRRIMEKK